ncbi:helix-turn-helix domain-containing protein [Thalassobius sp. MITS945101]|uniref:helix-turn-helix domain-containing protein n=1 Tax=Thalassobius sp. MITS945101 TaxID=3096994 RepID=UPI00399BF929
MPSSAPAFRNHKFSFAKGELGSHENLMTCVIVGCREPVLVCDDTNQTEAHAICIKPDVRHRVVIREGGAEIVYLDGVKLDGNAPKFRELPEAWQDLPTAIRVRDHSALASFRQVVNRDDTPADAGVMRIVERLYKDPFERLSQLDLAQELQLERTLAMRHFKSTTGQTFRKFKIWAAMMCAVDAAFNGEKVGLAGIQAGFSDAAHLTRTAATLFGVTPTQGLSGLSGFTSIAAHPNPAS